MANRNRWRGLSRHRIYRIDEAADALHVCRATIRRWIGKGLPAVADTRPALLIGAKLIDWLVQRRTPQTRTAPHEGYCVRCRAPQAPAPRTGQIVITAAGRPQLKGACIVCGTRMTKPLKREAVAMVAAQLADASRRAG